MAADLVSSFLDRYRLAALIQAVEDDLRGFIRELIVPFHDAGVLFGDLAVELARRAAAEGVLDPSGGVLVDYLDFGDAFALLNRHRAMLPPDLASLVRATTPAFETSVVIRNRVMHGRPLATGDAPHLAQLAQSLADADVEFPLTRAIAYRLVQEPDWTPLIEIATDDFGNVLHNLPLPDFDETGLLGREAELKQLRDLLFARRFPIVTVAGEGGIGKTALAVKALYDVVDSSESPYSAVLWSSLKTERLTGRGIEQVRNTTLDALSIAGDLLGAVADDDTSDIGLLAEVLRGTPTLVAIDNIESISHDEIRQLVTALPECQFLFTSRVGLGELEWRLTLGALGEQSAKAMLRQLAARRELMQIARLSDRGVQTIIDGLRRSPLAIRWFVEAVHAGGQPDDLIRDQSAVLQFCMSTIYDSLSADGRKLVECLLALDAPATIGQLSLLADLDRIDVQEQIYELQRRALIAVEAVNDALRQSYGLSEMADEYLRKFGPIDAEFAEHLRTRLRQIAQVDELMRQHDNTVALEPMAVVAETPEELAVADVLRQALRASRNGDLDKARVLIARARDAVPGYFETDRVAGFIEGVPRPEEARRLYASAYQLAPESQKPRVAYWMAGHLARNMMSAAEAEPFAREAHEALRLPGTALQLGLIEMYLHRHDPAEELFAEAAAQGNGKTILIAETDLLELARRRVEHLVEKDRDFRGALEAALVGIGRAGGILASGNADARYHERLAELVAEALLVITLTPDTASIQESLQRLLEAIEQHLVLLSRPALRTKWFRTFERIRKRPGLAAPQKRLADEIADHDERRSALRRDGQEVGLVLEYSARKRWGFIKPEQGANYFFHFDDVVDPRDCIHLVRGAEVTFTPRVREHAGELRMRADDVRAVLGQEERQRALVGRRAAVTHRTASFLFAADVATQEKIFVHSSTFSDSRDWQDATAGRILILDLDHQEQGFTAISGTARLARV